MAEKKKYDSDIVGWFSRGGKRIPIRKGGKSDRAIVAGRYSNKPKQVRRNLEPYNDDDWYDAQGIAWYYGMNTHEALKKKWSYDDAEEAHDFASREARHGHKTWEDRSWKDWDEKSSNAHGYIENYRGASDFAKDKVKGELDLKDLNRYDTGQIYDLIDERMQSAEEEFKKLNTADRGYDSLVKGVKKSRKKSKVKSKTRW